MFQDLLLSYDEGERRFFEQLYKEHRDEMFYTAYIVLENKCDAEDIVHESFIAVLDNMDKLIGDSGTGNAECSCKVDITTAGRLSRHIVATVLS